MVDTFLKFQKKFKCGFYNIQFRFYNKTYTLYNTILDNRPNLKKVLTKGFFNSFVFMGYKENFISLDFQAVILVTIK